ncbi:Protein FAM32A [Madurella mycetomatis]|uniref:Protein FAM32A n=1 Tax=Madurella mycetomatis TaxID=100816 RepID=A0A175W327_9PEZI|nr:Protein FAM32A [Madurella mycetomatis]
MPSDEYSSISRGPLKLKGVAGITKKKKKKDKTRATTDLEKNLSTGEGGDDSGSNTLAPPKSRDDGGTKRTSPESEPGKQLQKRNPDEAENEEEDTKTEAERRFAEAKRKRLKELTESGRIRPELLKTHKQRVEELNSHLSRLSEHHDMPKIGPG